MGVSKNRGGPPKSWFFIGFSILNHPFWGAFPLFLETPISVTAFDSSWTLSFGGSIGLLSPRGGTRARRSSCMMDLSRAAMHTAGQLASFLAMVNRNRPNLPVQRAEKNDVVPRYFQLPEIQHQQQGLNRLKNWRLHRRITVSSTFESWFSGLLGTRMHPFIVCLGGSRRNHHLIHNLSSREGISGLSNTLQLRSLHEYLPIPSLFDSPCWAVIPHCRIGMGDRLGAFSRSPDLWMFCTCLVRSFSKWRVTTRAFRPSQRCHPNGIRLKIGR